MLLLLAVYFLMLHLITAACPNGTISSYIDKTLCYSFQTTQLKFMEAQGVCSGMNGNLVSIHNRFEDVFISEEAETVFTESTVEDFWIGANNLLSPDSWTWIDGTTFDFTDWDKGQPQNVSMSNCGIMKIQDGNWKSDDCYKQKPFVCFIKINSPLETTTAAATKNTTTARPTTTTKKSKPLSCPVSWSYYNTTGYCYIVLHGEYWPDAEQRCTIEGGHLVSIHSLEEDLYVTHLRNSRDLYGAWIGLYTEDNNQNWKWTDGTPVDYINWRPGYPINTGQQSIGDLITGSPDGKTGDWINGEIRGWKNTFICKTSPS